MKRLLWYMKQTDFWYGMIMLFGTVMVTAICMLS